MSFCHFYLESKFQARELFISEVKQTQIYNARLCTTSNREKIFQIKNKREKQATQGVSV